MIRFVLAMFVLGMPVAAEACASCISTPYGDQSYNWPYLVLILLPFAVGTVIAGVMIRVTGVGVADFRRWFTEVLHPASPEEETT